MRAWSSDKTTFSTFFDIFHVIYFNMNMQIICLAFLFLTFHLSMSNSILNRITFCSLYYSAAEINLLCHFDHNLTLIQAKYLLLLGTFVSQQFINIEQGCQTGSPRARCVTCRPRPPQLHDVKKHREASHDGNVMP